MDNYLAFDIGGTFIKFGIVSEDGDLLESGKMKTPGDLNSLLSILAEKAGAYPGVKGIAVSAPGSVSNDGVIYGSSAIPFLHGPNIKNLIADGTGKRVFLENDANCAAYAEVWKGAAKGKKDVLVVVIGTGIGGAVIKNGEIHKGAHLHGGEFGYMLLSDTFTDSDDLWARRASMGALVRKVAKAKQVEKDLLSGEKIFEMAEAGDRDCIKAVDEFHHLLAIGIYNLQYIYDPEIILIGGGISAREELIHDINERLDRIIGAIHLAKLKPAIAACHFRQNANLLGAVYGIQKEIEEKNHTAASPEGRHKVEKRA